MSTSFKKFIEIVSTNIKLYRLKHKLSQVQVTDELGMALSAYGNYERGNKETPLSVLFKLSELYDISINEFFHKRVDLQELGLISTTSSSHSMTNSMIVNAKEIENLPMLDGSDAAIMIVDDSMKGVINKGEWAAIKKVEDVTSIFEGKTYLVVSEINNHRILRTVYRNPNKPKLIYDLIPRDKENYKPISIPLHDIKSMYVLIGALRQIST